MADEDKKKTPTLVELAEEFGPVMKDIPGEDDEDNRDDRPAAANVDRTPPGAIAAALGRKGAKPL